MKQWNGHVTEEWLKDWESGRLDETEQRQMQRHLGSCDFCAERFAEFLEKDLMEPPAYLREEILERSRGLEVQTVRTFCHASKRMRLLLYSMKVGLAVATSLFLLFFSSGIERAENPFIKEEPERTHISVTEKLDEGSSKVNEYLQEFTGWLLHIEYKEERND